MLETSVGALKAALHRGRERLREPEDGPAARRPLPSVALVDRFVALLNGGDRDGLIDPIQAQASVANLGVGEQYGEAFPRGRHSWVEGVLGGHLEWPDAFCFESQRAARAQLDGEPIVLFFRTRERWGGEALEAVIRLEEEDGRVSRVVSYGFCRRRCARWLRDSSCLLCGVLGTPCRVGRTSDSSALCERRRAPSPRPARRWVGTHLPVNPSGGVLNTNPIGASGMLCFGEAALQVMGRAGTHQVPNVKNALGHAYGGGAQHFSIAILSTEL